MNFNPGSEEHPVFYAGAWAHDQKHGHGQYVYATTTTYQGLWKEGKRHGIGIQVQYVDGKTAPPIIQQLLQAFTKVNGQIMFRMAGNCEEED